MAKIFGNLGELLSCSSLIAVDGDSNGCDGVSMRDMGDGAPFVSGYDTPEIWSNQCLQELELARKAKARMAEALATPGVQVFRSKSTDNTESLRPRVWGHSARWPEHWGVADQRRIGKALDARI